MAEIEISVHGFTGYHAVQIARIRRSVFTEELGIDAALDLDGRDEQAVHVLAKTAQQYVGTGRMLGDGHIGRVAVLPAWRHKQVGSRMMRALLRYAERKGLEQVFLGAQCSAVDFYHKLGFEVYGEAYVEVGICHRRMRRRLKRPPATGGRR